MGLIYSVFLVIIRARAIITIFSKLLGLGLPMDSPMGRAEV